VREENDFISFPTYKWGMGRIISVVAPDRWRK